MLYLCRLISRPIARKTNQTTITHNENTPNIGRDLATIATMAAGEPVATIVNSITPKTAVTVKSDSKNALIASPPSAFRARPVHGITNYKTSGNGHSCFYALILCHNRRIFRVAHWQ